MSISIGGVNLKQQFLFGRQTWTYMLMRIFFSAMSVILSLFINTFLLKAFGNFSFELISYQVTLRTAQPFAVFCALLISSRFGSVIAQASGLCMYLISLGMLCLFGDGVRYLYPVFALLLGFADAFFFCVNCMQFLSFTADENRDRFSSILSLIVSIISIFLPTVCGYLIQHFPNFTGYQLVFGFAAAFTVVCLILSTRLSVPQQKRSLPQIGHTLKRILSNKNCLRCIIANALLSCKGNVLGLFVTMLVYNLISNEAVIGLRSSLDSIAGLIGTAVYGIVVRSSNRTKSSVIAQILVLIPCLWMLFRLDMIVLMVFSIVLAFTNTFLSTPITFTYYKSVESLELHGDSGAVVQLAHDIFVALAGVPGFLLIALIPKSNSWAVALIVAMTLLSVVATFLVRIADKDLKANESYR